MAAAVLCRFFAISAFLFLVLASLVCSLSFNVSHIGPDDANERIKVEGDASITTQGIQLTPYERKLVLNYKAGRATYVELLHLWNNATGELADFTTNFTFNIDSDGNSSFADGLAFFLANLSAPFNATATAGGGIGLMDTTLLTSPEPFVAVVFDTFSNQKNMPMTSVSINIKSWNQSANSTEWLNDITKGKDNNASIIYRASSKILQVTFTEFLDGEYQTDSLSCEVDLREYLPEFVSIGFSGATGWFFEKNTVSSWQFDSTPLKSGSVPTSQNPKGKKGLVIGLIIGVLIVALLALAIYTCSEKICAAKGHNQITRTVKWDDNQIALGRVARALEKDNNQTAPGWGVERDHNHQIALGRATQALQKDNNQTAPGWAVERDHNHIALAQEMDDTQITRGKAMDYEFEKAGPKKFSYSELASATNNFSEKLGEGAFGGVYKGRLRDMEVAVKRVSEHSNQGIEQYAAEVKIISRLGHRNLVPLHGWCHEKGELLLVYEYMPGGSLDSYLFQRQSPLNWGLRYKIAQGLASALSYLHEEWEQCVLHRDIKSSNVLLDSNFNARLGDFGLASLVDHENAPEKTMCGFTLGYVAPECLSTGKTSKESDVYSFGIVALEIACGQSVIPWNKSSEGGKSLVEWVWDLYGMRNLLEAADPKLYTTFVKQEMQQLMIIGLWCAHPNSKARPQMRQVVNCLKFQLQLPNLPSKMPKLPYSPQVHFTPLSSASTSSSASASLPRTV